MIEIFRQTVIYSTRKENAKVRETVSEVTIVTKLKTLRVKEGRKSVSDTVLKELRTLNFRQSTIAVYVYLVTRYASKERLG